MSQAQFLADASRWVVQAAFWCSLAFAGWYSIWAPWWRSQIGRAIVALDSAIALALLPSTVGLMFGMHLVTSVFFSWLTVCAFACIPLITVYRAWIVWRVQRHAIGGQHQSLMARIRHRSAGEAGEDAG